MDWNLCALCQANDTGLIYPSKNKDPGVCGYSVLAKNIEGFTNENVPLPKKITVSINDLTGTGADVASHLRNMNAKWHKSCSLELSSSKLKRAIASREKSSNIATETPAKKTRTSLPARYLLGSNICFFCDLPGIFAEEASSYEAHKGNKETRNQTLHRVTTFNRDANIWQAALQMGDTKLLAKLSEGDLIAREITTCPIILIVFSSYRVI